ncbi:MAG: hypothetical protein ACR2M6_00050 [Vampirovibrionia bacterium]
MNRPPSPHPIKLATIREAHELQIEQTSTQKMVLDQLLAELKEIKQDIKEIKKKLI